MTNQASPGGHYVIELEKEIDFKIWVYALWKLDRAFELEDSSIFDFNLVDLVDECVPLSSYWDAKDLKYIEGFVTISKDAKNIKNKADIEDLITTKLKSIDLRVKEITLDFDEWI